MNGRYSLLITKRAKKDIDKLDIVAKKRLKKALLILKDKPFENSTKLVDLKLGSYRYRVGNHRIIFDIEKNNIIILRIGHRREIYR